MTAHLNLEIYLRNKDQFFERTMKHRANSLGLKGFLEHREDGSVYVELEGEEEALKSFIAEYEQGDESKYVIRMEPTYTKDYKGYDSFEFRN